MITSGKIHRNHAEKHSAMYSCYQEGPLADKVTSNLISQQKTKIFWQWDNNRVTTSHCHSSWCYPNRKIGLWAQRFPAEGSKDTFQRPRPRFMAVNTILNLIPDGSLQTVLPNNQLVTDRQEESKPWSEDSTQFLVLSVAQEWSWAGGFVILVPACGCESVSKGNLVTEISSV